MEHPSLDGTAAGLSRHIREYLETYVFGPEWAARVDEVAAARRKWKQEGLSFAALGKAVADLVSARGWLKKPYTPYPVIAPYTLHLGFSAG